VFSYEDRPNVISIAHVFELFKNTLHVWDIHSTQRLNLSAWTTAVLCANNLVSEVLGITIKLITQILAFFAYGGSSFVKALN
jgi:hypothetical protein